MRPNGKAPMVYMAQWPNEDHLQAIGSPPL